MSRNNPKYKKDLHQQAYDKLTSMLAFGQSKKAAKAEGTAGDKIFSFNTYDTYWKHIKYFLAYVKEKYPECTTLRSARPYVSEWLKMRENQGLSAWTVQTEAKALGKLFGITPEDEDYYDPPKRNRRDIKRSRGDAERDKHFSITNNDELIKFCRGTGLRRRELKALKGGRLMSREDIQAEWEELRKNGAPDSDTVRWMTILQDALLIPDVEHFICVLNGKGGRVRLSPVFGEHQQQIIDRTRTTPEDKRVWEYVSSNADIHSYRGDYATAIYKAYARPIEEIPYDAVHKGTGRKYQSDVYTCRKDEKGKKLDRHAMLICSKALGHNRISIVANNYIRNL